MAVYKRENGNWFVQFSFQGKTYIKSAKSKKKTDALDLERKMREDLKNHLVLGHPKEITCDKAIDMYLKHMEECTYMTGLIAKSKWLRTQLSGIYVHQISTALIHELIDKKKAEGVSASTLNSYLAFISSMNKLVKSKGYKPAVFDRPTFKPKSKKIRYLTVEEENRLLAALHPLRDQYGLAKPEDRTNKVLDQMQQNYDLVIFLLDTGARLNEIATIKWSDIDLDNGCMRLWRSKVGNESVLYLTDRTLSMLRRRRQNQTNEYVFTSGDGTTHKYTFNSIRRAIERAELKDVNIHTLRHTAATRMIQNGMNIYEVKEILGHRRIETTMIYAHLDKDQITQKARNILNKVNKDVQKSALKVVGL